MVDEDNGGDPVAPPVQQQALCAEHPDRDAVGTCARCGSFYCEACRGRRDGAHDLCRRCDDGRAYVPWEDATLGFWRRFGATLSSSVVALPRFAAELPMRGGYSRPLMFALLPTMVSAAIGSGVASAFMGAILHGIFDPKTTGAAGLSPGVFGVGAFVFYFASSVVSYLLYLALWPAVLLGSAAVFGANRLRYEGLFRILCYGSGFNFLYFFPVLGLLVGAYHVVVAVLCIGAHGRVSTLQALAIYGLPAFAFLGCCCGGYVLLMFAVMQ